MLNNLLLRLGFRGHDGKAKPGNLDENGNLKVKVSGNNLDENDNIKVADSNVSQQIVGLNQSITSLQTQISNLANIIGQTKGYDGSAWRNLKVDSQGRPVLASDVTVNAEGLVVDVGELDITDRPERELGKVQLSGTIDTVNYFANINDLSSNSEFYFSDLIIGRAPYIQFSFRFNKSTWKTIQISFHTHTGDTGDPTTDTSFIELPRDGYIYGTGSHMSGITKDIPLLSPYYKIGVKTAGALGVRMSSMAIVYKDSPTNPLDWLLEEGE